MWEGVLIIFNQYTLSKLLIQRTVPPFPSLFFHALPFWSLPLPHIPCTWCTVTACCRFLESVTFCWCVLADFVMFVFPIQLYEWKSFALSLVFLILISLYAAVFYLSILFWKFSFIFCILLFAICFIWKFKIFFKKALTNQTLCFIMKSSQRKDKTSSIKRIHIRSCRISSVQVHSKNASWQDRNVESTRVEMEETIIQKTAE